ncbi:class I SAM-dependent methyltransferase [Streptomyces sp. NPDC087849]|uniref:class I SAM-dependent methyltransferase n=1 Tax=Streptomyces sp. NPDC087849 TaxID=3365808 RepID=UPI00380DCC9D
MNSPHHQDIEWDASGTHREREARLHAPALTQTMDWLRDLLRTSSGGHTPIHRVLDIGSGPGVVTCLLAHTFPDAEIIAVDRSPAILERVRSRAVAQGMADRVHTQLMRHQGEFDSLGSADLIWSRNGVRHMGDQEAALRSLAGSLRRGGLLAVAESGLPPRFLPRDIGMGRPGLQARLDAAAEDAFAEMRDQLPGSAQTVEDWPTMLARAGLIPSGTRSFFTDLPSPLGMSAREYLHTRLSRLRDRIGDRLDPEDRATLECLVDRDTYTGILGRPDAFYLAAATVHTARSCRTGVQQGFAG